MRLYCILADVENWDCRVEITKEEFEAQLSNNNDLAATYVENFSNKAGYVILPFLIEEEETWIEFFLMIHQGDIVLTLWKKSDKEYDYL
jgi:hypothetical protein